MMKKILILIFCGIVSPSLCSIIKIQQAIQEPLYRPDIFYRIDSGIRPESYYKRESVYQKELNGENEASIPQRPQIVSSEPIYGTRLVPHILIPQQRLIQLQRGMQPVMASEGEVQNESVMRPEPILRTEPFIKREHKIPSVLQAPLQPTVQILREGPNLRNNPDIFFPPSPCARIHERRNVVHKFRPMEQQNSIFPVRSQMPQQFQQNSARVLFENPVINPQVFHPVTAIPRIQHFVPQNSGAPMENVQYSSGSTQNNQENSNYGNEYQNSGNNFQNSQHANEEMQEDMSPAVTARAVPSIPNPLSLKQISSIC